MAIREQTRKIQKVALKKIIVPMLSKLLCTMKRDIADWELVQLLGRTCSGSPASFGLEKTEQ